MPGTLLDFLAHHSFHKPMVAEQPSRPVALASSSSRLCLPLVRIEETHSYTMFAVTTQKFNYEINITIAT